MPLFIVESDLCLAAGEAGDDGGVTWGQYGGKNLNAVAFICGDVLIVA